MQNNNKLVHVLNDCSVAIFCLRPLSVKGWSNTKPDFEPAFHSCWPLNGSKNNRKSLVAGRPKGGRGRLIEENNFGTLISGHLIEGGRLMGAVSGLTQVINHKGINSL